MPGPPGGPAALRASWGGRGPDSPQGDGLGGAIRQTSGPDSESRAGSESRTGPVVPSRREPPAVGLMPSRRATAATAPLPSRRETACTPKGEIADTYLVDIKDGGGVQMHPEPCRPDRRALSVGLRAGHPAVRLRSSTRMTRERMLASTARSRKARKWRAGGCSGGHA